MHISPDVKCIRSRRIVHQIISTAASRGRSCNQPRSYAQSAGILCAICRDPMCNSPRSYVQSAEITCAARFAESICTIRCEHMYHSPRAYVQFAKSIRTIRLDHACNIHRDRVIQSTEVKCAIRQGHVIHPPRSYYNSPEGICAMCHPPRSCDIILRYHITLCRGHTHREETRGLP